MKKLIVSIGILVSIFSFSACKQHDTSSPDSAGSLPVDKRSESGTSGTGDSSNMNPNSDNLTNNGSNNNGQSRSADSMNKR